MSIKEELNAQADRLAVTLKQEILAQLADIATGTYADLQAYASSIARRAVDAAISGDNALMAELKAEVLAIGEIGRVRVAKRSRAAAQRVLTAVLGSATAILGTLARAAIG